MPAIKATLVGLKRLDEALKKAELRTRAAARVSVDQVSRRTQLAIRKDAQRRAASISERIWEMRVKHVLPVCYRTVATKDRPCSQS